MRGEFEDLRPAKDDRNCVLTMQFIYIPEGNFSPWERTRSGWGSMSSGRLVVVLHQWSTGPAWWRNLDMWVVRQNSQNYVSALA